MTRRRGVEQISRAVEEVCRRALEYADGGQFPQVRRVWVERCIERDSIRMRFEWAVEGKDALYTESRVDLWGYNGSVPRPGDLHRAAERMVSHIYEDHNMQRAEQLAREALGRSQTAEEFALRSQQWDYLRNHVRDVHRPTDAYLRREMLSTFSYDVATDQSTATEVRMRQEMVERASREHARRIDDMAMSVLGIRANQQSSTVDVGDGESLSIERLLEAARILGQMRVPEPSTYRGHEYSHVWFDEAVNLPDHIWGGEIGSEEAQQRGLTLLKENLTPTQLQDYETHKYFEVTGGSTGATYRIKHGRQMNISELNPDGSRKCGWCFLPQGALVAGDVMLSQKIALELFEKEALAVANRF